MPSNVATLPRAMHVAEPIRPRDFTPAQKALIRKTVAADATTDEFDLFMQVAQRAGLDPFRKQVYCIVYNRDDEKKRKMSIITGIDGLRAVAARNRDYRPDDEPPAFEVDAERKGPSNPEGLVKCTARVFKFGPDGQWHPAVGVAYWTEFAPMKLDEFDWIDTGEKWPDTGKPKKKKVPKEGAVPVPSGKWADMPHVMLAKCAEAQALRKGWPEDLSGIYSPEEMDQAMVDITASAEVEMHQQEQRLRRIGAIHTIPLIWRAGAAVELVPIGEAHDRICDFARRCESPTELDVWRQTNAAGLNTFWAAAKTDALDARETIEARLVELQRAGEG